MKKILRYVLVSIFLLFSWPFFMYKKYGNKKIKPTDKTIIICNHYSDLDGFFIHLVFRSKTIRFVTITAVKQKPLTKFIAWLFDCIYLDYNTTNLQFFKDCIKILNDGGIICIFPEGAVNTRKYGFFDFKKSFIYLAKKTNANILPLYLYPDYKVFKKSKIYIGEQYSPAAYKKLENDYAAATFFQCKIIEYSSLVNT